MSSRGSVIVSADDPTLKDLQSVVWVEKRELTLPLVAKKYPWARGV